MVRYRTEFRPAADREFRSLSRETQIAIRPVIDALSENPRPFGVKKLKGERDLYRIKAGPGKAYRIVYQVRDEVLLVLIVKVGHRKEIYR